MNGRTLGCLLVIVSAGCDDVPPAEKQNAEPSALAEKFDPAVTGTIEGEVIWPGAVPTVPPFFAPNSPSGVASIGPRHKRPNPYAPVIDAKKQVEGAVVFLRAVEAQRSRPWDLPAVRVEMCDYDYRVRQGEAVTRTGFVRRGETVEFVSHQAIFHSVRARGDAFFTLAFPDPDQPRQHVFDRPGVVELSSAAGFFWARAHLFVAEHPYYTRTDATGRFTLARVPRGEYELVCWLPDWKEKSHELDSDSWQLSRLTFKDPIERTQRVRVVAGQATTTRFSIKED